MAPVVTLECPTPWDWAGKLVNVLEGSLSANMREALQKAGSAPCATLICLTRALS
jgi:hypothetical protein